MTDSQTPFGDRLANVLMDKKLTQTDLARLVFNEPGVDNRGYDIWKGKDRISSYINNRQRPSPRNYRKILEVLEMTPEELPLGPKPLTIRMPGRASPNDHSAPMEMTVLAEGGGVLSRLRINSLISVEAALQIMQIVNADRERRAARAKDAPDEVLSSLVISEDEP